jgi:hypothetical protein
VVRQLSDPQLQLIFSLETKFHKFSTPDLLLHPTGDWREPRTVLDERAKINEQISLLGIEIQ